MNTARMNRQKKSVSRVFAISAALGVALMAGSPTAASAVEAKPTPQITKSASVFPSMSTDDRRSEKGGSQAESQDSWGLFKPTSGHHKRSSRGGGEDGDCKGLIVLLCA
ncbi:MULTISPECIES: hypothetical protein [Streptomyces]|uniref:hypothetical protein n=1 Tax=Streptomyces TaxID=1883 RepID=UPI001964D273|nr:MULTISPECIES: hypothetical protein [Streptomyces]QRX90035.1 hypothetical protein JNO44_03405 [Streptomyces noursei]UJB39971.1 hypothetical protein HRD51_02845 [Streptomyces sp. A1-5]